ncbi:MAG: PEFG-CTERM sorting domain-containing protein [Candidatus Nitrosotenuis sp.]
MNAYTHVLIAISVLTAVITTVPALASSYDEEACPDCPFDFYENDRDARYAEVPIRAWTDKKLYDHASEIVVQGVVANIKQDIPITIRVIGPTGNLVRVDQVDVASDKTFEAAISTAGSLFKQNGVYTIRIQYGPQEINDKMTVEIIGEESSVAACAADEIAVKSTTDTYCMPYSAPGLSVTKATVSSELSSITLKVDTMEDGSITLMIPRDVLDSTSGNEDTDFIVLVDGEEADFEEIDADGFTRTIEIMVPEGATEIEIIGTWAVPEFGTMAAIILAVAIVSIIAVSAKSRLVLPKY